MCCHGTVKAWHNAGRETQEMGLQEQRHVPDLVVIGIALRPEEGWREGQCGLQGVCILHPHAAAVEVCKEPPTGAQTLCSDVRPTTYAAGMEGVCGTDLVSCVCCVEGLLVCIGVEAVSQFQALKIVLHLWKHCCDASKCCINVKPAHQSSSPMNLPDSVSTCHFLSSID